MIRRLYFQLLDRIEMLLGLKDEFDPPRHAVFGIGGGFDDVGKEFFRYFVEYAELSPDERVLDIGCGIGRMAVPLTTYLSSSGEYRGFDIVREWVDWCNDKISGKFPNFRFLWSDVYNGKYNPDGKVLSSEYTFPFEDDYFHFVFATSVFTHMFPEDLDRYLSEIARILQPDGRCLITYFLLNEESKRLMNSGDGDLIFDHDLGSCFTVDLDEPETALAYDEELIRGVYNANHLKILEPIWYGSWSGRERLFSYQDIVLASKC